MKKAKLLLETAMSRNETHEHLQKKIPARVLISRWALSQIPGVSDALPIPDTQLGCSWHTAQVGAWKCGFGVCGAGLCGRTMSAGCSARLSPQIALSSSCHALLGNLLFKVLGRL